MFHNNNFVTDGDVLNTNAGINGTMSLIDWVGPNVATVSVQL